MRSNFSESFHPFLQLYGKQAEAKKNKLNAPFPLRGIYFWSYDLVDRITDIRFLNGRMALLHGSHDRG